MIHELRLNKEPFEAIKKGNKTIEMRLYDDKRKLIKTGDTINFKLRDDETKKLIAEVVDIKVYRNFNELYSNYNKIALGYDQDENADPKDMLKYYSDQEQKEYGVVAIHIKLR